MSSCVFLTRKNQSPAAGPPDKIEFTGHAIAVAELRVRVAKSRRLDPLEVELTLAGRLQTDQHGPIQRQSTVVVRRKPTAALTHSQKALAAQTAAWARTRSANPVTPAVPLSQQKEPSFGLGTFQTPGTTTYAYPDTHSGPSVPRLSAPPPAQPQFPVRFPSETQHEQPDTNGLPRPPKEFACSLCHGWIADAHILRCCGVSVCKACVDDASFHDCRDCRAALPGGGSGACLRNRNLQAIIYQTQLQMRADTTDKTNASPANDTPSSPSSSCKTHAAPGSSAPVQADPNDLYAILGIASHSTQSEISKAYRMLALQLHPDKQQDSVPDPDKTAQFVKLAAAYELLSDTEARRRYDHSRMVNSMRAKRQRR